MVFLAAFDSPHSAATALGAWTCGRVPETSIVTLVENHYIVRGNSDDAVATVIPGPLPYPLPSGAAHRTHSLTTPSQQAVWQSAGSSGGGGARVR